MPPVKNKKSDLNQISHYSLQEVLVEQPFTVIYRATDEKTGKTVFLVTLRPEAVTGDLPDRFLRRAETAAQLAHENILPISDHGTAEKRPYAVFPYHEGQFLADHPLLTATPDPANHDHVLRAIELVKQLAAGLAAAHPTGLFHHDLRPENIFVDATGQPLLLDLVVPPTPPPPAPAATEGPSQLDYRSPEQLAGKTLSGRSNVFSLGILLYRLLAGQLPPLPVSEWDIFEHKGTARELPLNELRPGLTEATYTAVRDSIWQKEWSRYETAADQQKALELALAAESAPPPPPLPAWRLLARRVSQPKILKIVVPAFVVLVLLLLVMLWARGGARQRGAAAPTPESGLLPGATELLEPASPTAAATEAEEMQEAEAQPLLSATAPPTPTPTATTAPATPTELPPSATTAPDPTSTEPTQPINTSTSEPTEVANCVPSPPFGWVLYTIQASDSLSAIGQATNTTVQQLQEVNCLEGTLLSVGQQIWVPFSPVATNTPVPPTAVPGSPTSPPPGPNPTSPPPPIPPTPTVKPP